MFSSNKRYNSTKKSLNTLNKKKNNIVKNVNPGKTNKLITHLADNLTDNISNKDNTTQILNTITKQINDNISDNLSSNTDIKNTTAKIKDNNLKIMELIATDKVWLRVNSDNKSIKDMILKKNDHYKIKGKKFFKIDIGNAGGIKILLDNTTFPINGKKGEVKRIFINLDNLSKSKH